MGWLFHVNQQFHDSGLEDYLGDILFFFNFPGKMTFVT